MPSKRVGDAVGEVVVAGGEGVRRSEGEAEKVLDGPRTQS